MGIFGKVFKSKTKRLIDDLKNDNLEVRKRAVLELASMGESAVEPLIEALSSEFKLTFGPQSALAEIGEPAIEPLIRTLKDSKSNELTRTGAVIALAKMSDGAGESLIRTLRDKAVEPLIETLSRGYCKGNKFMFSGICAALGNFGDSRAVEPLRSALEAWKNDKVMQDIAKKALEKIR